MASVIKQFKSKSNNKSKSSAGPKKNNKRSCVEHRPDLKTPSEDYQEQKQQQEQVFGEQDYQDQEKINKSKSKSSLVKIAKTKTES